MVVLGFYTYLGRTPSSPPTTNGVVDETVAAIIADGLVEENEYRMAFQNFVRCVEDSGFRVVGTVYDPVARQWGYRDIAPLSTDTSTDAGLARRIQDRCYERYLDWVTTLWLAQSPKSGQNDGPAPDR